MVRKLFRDALTIQILSAILGVIGMVVDGAVTGSCLGADAMAAYGFATPVATVFIACSAVIGTGSSMLIGRIVGARNMKEAGEALSTCLMFSVILSFVLIAVVMPLARPIALLLGAKGELTEMAADYLRGFCLCAPALMVLMVLMPVMQIDGNSRLMMIAVMAMTVVNIAGDLLNGLVFHGGLFGMAMATTVSYFVALVIMLLPFIRKKNTIPLRAGCLKPACIGEMLTGGMPAALQQICRSVLLIILNRLLLSVADNRAVAALTAIMAASNLAMVLGSGIATAVSMLTGVFIGDRDDVAIRELIRLALRKAILYNAAVSLVLIAGAGVLMPMFLKDAEGAAMAIHGFRLWCLCTVFYSVNVTLRQYYQAMKKLLLSYLYVICNSLLLTALSAVILSGLIGTDGIWLSFLAGEGLSLILLILCLRLRSKDRKSLTECLFQIPEDLSADVIDRFDGIADSVETVAGLSGEVAEFCRKNRADDRLSYILPLAVEEFGVRILSVHMHTPGRNKVEIRLLNKTESWALRIRDNGKRLNILRIMSGENADDFSYTGVRILQKLLTEIRYMETLNVNNLYIEIPKGAEIHGDQ